MNQSQSFFAAREITYLHNGPYTFEVGENEVLGLTGSSGIGKTQLLRALVDTLPHGGEVFLDGRNSMTYPAPEWRKKVALVPADSIWWYESVGEHLSRGDVDASIRAMLELLGFSSDIFEWQISRLSGGERQRLSLVRALITSPAVLLLDEPCSALDHHFTEIVEKILLQYTQRSKTALILVSHDMEQLHRMSGRLFGVRKDGLDALSQVS